MASKRLLVIGIVLIIIGIAMGIYDAKAEAEGPVWYIKKNCTLQGREGPAEVYTCPKHVGFYWFEFPKRFEVEEATMDLKTETYYFRFTKYFVIVKKNSDGTSKTTVEDHSRLRSGHFVYLGPGFGPASPRSSSGGSSGSGGGVK